jgi:hypothetical protein
MMQMAEPVPGSESLLNSGFQVSRVGGIHPYELRDGVNRVVIL